MQQVAAIYLQISIYKLLANISKSKFQNNKTYVNKNTIKVQFISTVYMTLKILLNVTRIIALFPDNFLTLFYKSGFHKICNSHNWMFTFLSKHAWNGVILWWNIFLVKNLMQVSQQGCKQGLTILQRFDIFMTVLLNILQNAAIQWLWYQCYLNYIEKTANSLSFNVV